MPLTMQLFRSSIYTCMLMCASAYDFLGERVTFHVLEEQSEGTVVGNLTESVMAKYRVELAVARSLKFQLIEQPYVDDGKYDDHSMFDIDVVSGVMTMTERIDREAICSPTSRRGDDVCAIVLLVRISPVNVVGDVYVRVVIEDINDHDPVFPSDIVHVSFPESVTPGALIQLPGATDLDLGENGRLSYELVSLSDMFELDVLGDDGRSADVFLRLKTFVDREEQSVFSLLVVAMDSGSPRRTGTLSVLVVVSDVNDNPPRFSESRYEFTTLENCRNGSVVGHVQATDSDEGDNARVTYAVTRVNGHGAGDECPLTVDAETGDIVVVGELDFERRAEFVLTVIAADCAPPPLRQFAYARVIIRLIDENDNKPEVTPVGGRSATMEVAESSGIGTTVLDLSVYDADSDRAGEIDSCQVTDVDPDQQVVPFSLRRRQSSAYVDVARYSLVIEAVLDRETVDRYPLLVVCVDAGEQPMTGHTTLDIRVSDVNDNAPQFRHVTPISVSLPENNDIGDYVMTVVADDPDVGENATVSYYIRCVEEESNGSEVALDIDNVTGIVRAAVSLDRERRSSYDCVVVAADGGRSSLTSSATLLLSVVDVDDELPVFESREYEFVIAENQPAGSFVGRVKANDADQPPFNTVLYSLEPGDDVSNDVAGFPFLIDERSGVVSTRRPLDRETDGIYFRFHITAGNGSMSRDAVADRAAVKVHVTDVNDNPPIILFPVCVVWNVTECELDVTAPSPGDVITRVIAVDPDDSDAPLRYALIDDDATGRPLFGVNLSTGEVYVRREQPGVDGQRQFELRVRVTDGGSPPLTATVSLVVHVNGTRHERLGVDDVAARTSRNLAVSLLAVAAAAVFLSIICVAAARHIGARSDDKSEVRRDATYVSPSAAYLNVDDDDVSCTGAADCSTDVVLGSSLHVQDVVPAAVIVDRLAVGTMSSRHKCPVHRSSQADCHCHEARRLLLIQNHDIYRVKQLNVNCEESGYVQPSTSGRRLSATEGQYGRHVLPTASAGLSSDRHRLRHNPSCRCHPPTAASLPTASTAPNENSDGPSALTDFRHHGNHVTEADSALHVDASAADIDEASRRQVIDDRLARWPCGSCSVRQVALGAIVAGHVYNDVTRRNSDPRPAASTNQRRSLLYL